MTGGNQVKSLGVLTFSDEGILFVGDNLAGAIHAFDCRTELKTEGKFEINVYKVDVQIAAALGTTQSDIRINDIAVHPKSGEVFLTVTRGHGLDAMPALMKVDAANQIHNIDLSELSITSQPLGKLVDADQRFTLRGTMGMPPTTKEIAKSKHSLRVLSVVDIEFYNGEVFVAGISNEDFSSVLRRIPYPFNGTEHISNIEMYHIAHDMYETRAPIRSMLVKEIDGIDQLIAAYTCSPMVLIPINELKDGAKVKAKTIGDMGNGQPIDMVSFNMKGKEMLFVTNNSRSPRVIPVDGLNNARVVTDKDFERGPKLDLGPILPFGPMGKPIMFTGTSLRIDLLNESQFISLNRDAESGSLDLETLHCMMPIKMHNVVGGWDIPNPNASKKLN